MATLSEADISAIGTNLRSVLDRVGAAYDSTPIEIRSPFDPKLIKVSKTKPASAVLAAYRFGQRHFGENYVQELIAKANDPAIVAECDEIRWHFIGHLQTNKIAKLVQSVPNLYMVETVDSEKCARKLNDVVKERIGDAATEGKALRVMVEVNTSGEPQKSGVKVEEAGQLATLIKTSCPALRFVGFMTIGLPDAEIEGINPDFLRLFETRKAYCAEHSVENEKSVELSMGMSADFEDAIKMGSTNVRVGSTIFGSRGPRFPETE